MDNFDLSSLALEACFPKNKVIVDNAGLPSVMVYVPKFKTSEVIDGAAETTHSAFIIDGVEKPGIWISKYQNVVHNGRAYSLPGRDPAASLTFDAALSYCSAKGIGWHLMTNAEWAAIALWCKKNGFMPKGNNRYGKDYQETLASAVPTSFDGQNQPCRIATGTGLAAWYHDNQFGGIADLNGNINEFCGGLKVVGGEIQVLENNNAANSTNSQAADSGLWKAILADGTLVVPGTADTLKLDYVSNKWQLATTLVSQANESRYCMFKDIQAGGLTVPQVLKELALFPADSTGYNSERLYLNNGAGLEQLLARGGNWGSLLFTGVFLIFLDKLRNYTHYSFGFRSAYYE